MTVLPAAVFAVRPTSVHVVAVAHAFALSRALPLAFGLALAVAPSRSLAFSDPVSFADPVDLGGGGGRFFTGSPADGYTCAVCHAGAQPVTLAISGVPLAGYLPQAAYEIVIAWPASIEHVGLAMEISDRSGRGAGSVRLPPSDELPDVERCEPFEDGLAAGRLTALADRTVLSVPDCGARRVRLLWTAPASGAGPLWFTGGFVRSDAQVDDRGDGVTVFAQVIAPAAEPDAPRSSIDAGCAAAAPYAATRASVALASVAAAFALLLARRARRR